MKKLILILLCIGGTFSSISGQSDNLFKDVDWEKIKLEPSGFNTHGLLLSDSAILSNYYPLYQALAIPTIHKFNLSKFSGVNYKQLSYNIGTKISISPFSESSFFWGTGEINNIGLKTRWQLSNQFFLEGGVALSKQDNYMLHHTHISSYLNLKLNYRINPQFSLNLWSQYVLRRNSNLLMSQFDFSPKTSIMIGSEYKPTTNVKMQIGAGVQEDIVRKNKYQFVIEGKTSITF